MAKLLNVFPKSLKYLAHCFDKGGEENEVTTAEICDWWNFIPNSPPPPIKKKKEGKEFSNDHGFLFHIPPKRNLCPHTKWNNYGLTQKEMIGLTALILIFTNHC